MIRLDMEKEIRQIKETLKKDFPEMKYRVTEVQGAIFPTVRVEWFEGEISHSKFFFKPAHDDAHA